MCWLFANEMFVADLGFTNEIFVSIEIESFFSSKNQQLIYV